MVVVATAGGLPDFEASAGAIDACDEDKVASCQSLVHLPLQLTPTPPSTISSRDAEERQKANERLHEQIKRLQNENESLRGDNHALWEALTRSAQLQDHLLRIAYQCLEGYGR